MWHVVAVWELYTGEDAFERLQHPGQFFETVVLQVGHVVAGGVGVGQERGWRWLITKVLQETMHGLVRALVLCQQPM
jgi:hypothetical protein